MPEAFLAFPDVTAIPIPKPELEVMLSEDSRN